MRKLGKARWPGEWKYSPGFWTRWDRACAERLTYGPRKGVWIARLNSGSYIMSEPDEAGFTAPRGFSTAKAAKAAIEHDDAERAKALAAALSREAGHGG